MARVRQVRSSHVVLSRREQWVAFCEHIGGEEAIVTKLAELIHEQRGGSELGSVGDGCNECPNRARLFFDAAAEADWWPLGYGIFKMLSNLMGCTEQNGNFTPPDEED